MGISFGDPRITPGGRAKNYWYSTRVELKRDEWITEGERRNQRKTGISIKCLIKKNKTFPPERTASFDFFFDHNELQVPPGSYDHAKELVTLGLYYEIFKVKASYYYLGEDSWHGRAALEEQLRWDLTMQEKLREAIRQYASKGVRPEDTPQSPRRLVRVKK